MTAAKLTAGQEVRKPEVSASGTCGWTWSGTERAWPWVADRHAHAHRKGIDGLPATCSLAITRPDPKPETTENDR